MHNQSLVTKDSLMLMDLLCRRSRCLTSALHQSHESFCSNNLDATIHWSFVLHCFSRRHHHASSDRVDRVWNQTRRYCHHFTHTNTTELVTHCQSSTSGPGSVLVISDWAVGVHRIWIQIRPDIQRIWWIWLGSGLIKNYSIWIQLDPRQGRIWIFHLDISLLLRCLTPEDSWNGSTIQMSQSASSNKSK